MSSVPYLRRLVVCGLALLGLMAFAGAAAATIVPQRSIARIALGTTKTAVRAKLGKPLRVRTGKNDFGRYTELVYRRVTVSFQSGNTATALATTSRLERTPRGAGIGSTKAQLRARVDRIKCETRHCFVGAFLPGRRVTDFFLRNGRVTRVVVGYVID